MCVFRICVSCFIHSTNKSIDRKLLNSFVLQEYNCYYTKHTDLCVLQSPLTNCVTLVVKQVELMKICFHYCVYELLPHISFVLLFTNQSLMHQNQSSKLILNMNYVIVHVCMRICINVILQF